MITKAQVLEILDRFKAYSAAQEAKYESYFTSLMSPLYSAVETYFSTKHPEMEGKLKELVHNMYCDLLERNTQNEFNYGDPLPTDYPETYNDIRKCFYQFPLQNTSDAEFYGAWVFGIPTDEMGMPIGTEEIPLSNSLVSSWTGQISTAKQTEFDDVVTLLDWIQNASSTNDMVNLLEDTGLVVSSPSMQDVAKSIYLDKHLLEVIKTLNLNVYIPTYLR